MAGVIGVLALALLVGTLFYWSGGKTSRDNSAVTIDSDNNKGLKVESESIPSATQKTMKATIKTTKGDIELELYPNVAPKTAANFVKLAESKFYDGTKFHRVIADFMIQGGDPLSKTNDPRVGTGGPGYQFTDEINPKALGLSTADIQQLEAAGYTYDFALPSLPVDVGAIAMANSGPNTNGSQFFIVTIAPQPHLNGRHTVFGKVVAGMDVVRKIAQGDVIQGIVIQGQ